MARNDMAHFILITSSLLLILHSTSALSSPSSSPLQGFHHSTTSTTKVTNADLRQNNKPPIRPYIPDGLTKEQYRTIKQNEIAQKRSMNLGAWGPRFKRMNSDPDNNWFNLPSLWTNGYTTAPNNAIATNDNKSIQQQKNVVRVIGLCAIRYLRRYGISYLFILTCTQLLLSSRIISAKQIIVLPLSSSLSSSSKKLLLVVLRLLLPLVILKPLHIFATMLVTKLSRIRWWSKDGANR